MHRFKLLALASLIVLVISGIASSAASAALPEFLGTFSDAFTAKTLGVARLVIPGTATVECLSESNGKGEVKNKKEATFDELFLGCITRVAGLSVKCTGLPDKITGSILATGKATVGYELNTTNPLLILTPGEVHFECASAGLVNVKGCFAGKLSPRNVSTTSATLEGKGAIEDYTNDTGKTIACELLGSVNGATFKLATEQIVADITFATAIEVMA